MADSGTREVLYREVLYRETQTRGCGHKLCTSALVVGPHMCGVQAPAEVAVLVQGGVKDGRHIVVYNIVVRRAATLIDQSVHQWLLPNTNNAFH